MAVWKALDGIAQCLTEDGVYVMGDLHTPKDRCGIAGDDSAMGLYGMSTFLCLPSSAGAGGGGEGEGEGEGALGPGAAWSVEEARALIGQSRLELVETVSSQPYFAYHICRKRPVEQQ